MKNYLLLFTFSGLLLSSCTKDPDQASVSDATLVAMASSDELQLKRTAPAGDNLHWDIRMNDIAAHSLAAGLPSYPSNAMLVKVKHDASGAITGYDIMYKAPGDPNSEGGWLYSSVNVHGEIINGVNTKGTSCTSCHSAASKGDQH